MKKQKIWLKRLIPVVCLLVYIIILSEIFYRSMVRSTTEKCWEELYAARDSTTEEISIHLSTNLTLLDLASDGIMMYADFSDEDTVLEYLSEVLTKTMFDRIDVIFPDGTILVQLTGERVKDNGEKAYIELVEKGVHWSQRVPDFLTEKPAIHAFSPIYDENGNPIAILGATAYCETLGRILHSTNFGDETQLFIVDRRDGNLILDKWHEKPGSIYDMTKYDSLDGYEDISLVDEIMSGKTGDISYTSKIYKKTSYTIYAPIYGTSFSIAIVAQEDTVMEYVNNIKITLTWVGVIEVALLIVLAIWIYFIMKRSMESEIRARSAELELLHKKEQELQSQYENAAKRREFLETMAVNLPGGYHRCTTDHSFKLTFISKSFTKITGYTEEQLNSELNGSYLGIVAPEDREYFMSLAPKLEEEGYIDCSYRMRRRDGTIRWVQDTTQYVERDGEKYYQCALMDISEQIEEIEQAKHAAEASSQAKSTFLFNISHDIRTPMNAIIGFSHIISENPDDPELVKSTISKLRQAGSSLMMLINDVLDISRIERGKEDLNLQPLNLYDHEKNLYEMFASDMKAAGIEFRNEGEKIRDRVYCDRLKLTRILMNMLSNAKKFTPRGGSVSFGAETLYKDEECCTYRFFVKDTGIGMSQEFLSRAFVQFERARTSTESGVTGSGLGLAIIKMMVELMGGSVDIQSELGKGTEISATITFKRADDNNETIENAIEANSKNFDGKRALLVEDNSFNREIAKYILESIGFSVDEAENGAEGIEKLTSSAGEYDIIFMDIQMPVMDGYTATIEIRNLSDSRKAHLPIVAMTANAFEEDKRKCIEIGMDGHIGKPIDMTELSSVLLDIFK